MAATIEPKQESASEAATRMGQLGRTVRISFKVGIVAFSTVYLVLLLTGSIDPESKFGPSEYALIAFTVLFVADFFDKLTSMSVGKEGFTLRLRDMESRQQNLENLMSAMQVALKGLVSKWEYRHLVSLEMPESYTVAYGDIFFEEIKRLDRYNFIRPTPANKEGFNALERYKNGQPFDLKKYMTITEEGKAYLHMRKLLQVVEYESIKSSSAGT